MCDRSSDPTTYDGDRSTAVAERSLHAARSAGRPRRVVYVEDPDALPPPEPWEAWAPDDYAEPDPYRDREP